VNNVDDEIDTIARQAWHNSSRPEGYDEIEAYLRKHTLNGAMREFHDACTALGKAIMRDMTSSWLKILDTLGM